MEVSDKLLKYITIGLGGAVVVLAIMLALTKRSNEQELVRLQNEVAKRDQTIEVQKGVYAKLALQQEDLRSAIDKSTEEGRRLADEVKRTKAELLSVTGALVKLKDQVASGQGQQTDQGGRKRVEFAQDFGYARVDGFTLTDPPEYQLKLGQGSRPLKLTLALTQQKDGSWKTLAASSDPNVAVEIGVTGVNPYILEPHWYERLRLSLDLGVGPGVLGGVGATYGFGRFEVGPKLWGVVSDGKGNVFYGGTLTWAPFKK